LRNGRVIPVVFPRKTSALENEQIQAGDSGTSKDVGQSNGADTNSNFDEVLKLIKKSEYKVVD